MKQKYARTIKLAKTNPPLVDCLVEDYFNPLSYLSFETLENVLDGDDVLLSSLSEDTSINSKMPYFENMQNKERGWKVFITHGLIHETNDNKNFMPIVLIPVYLFTSGDNYAVRIYGDVRFNPLIKDIITKYNISILGLKKSRLTPYDLDKFCRQFFNIPNRDVVIENYLCIANTDYPNIIINHDLFKSNGYDSSCGEHYLSSEAKFFTQLNYKQRLAVERASVGQSFALVGAKGTGKSTVLFNIIANALIKGKKVAYIANEHSSIVNMHNLFSSLNINHELLTFNTIDTKTSQLNLNIQDLVDREKLKKAYFSLDKYIASLSSRILDHRASDIMTELIEIGPNIKPFKFGESELLNIYKNEYLNICAALKKVDMILTRLAMPAGSIYNLIPLKTNSYTAAEAFKTIQKLEVALNDTIEAKVKLEKKFNVNSTINYAGVKAECINLNIGELESFPISWRDNNFLRFEEAKNLLPKLAEKLKAIKAAKENIVSLYDNYGDYNTDIKTIFSSYFSGNDNTLVNRAFSDIEFLISLTTNASRLAMEVVESFKKVVDEHKYTKEFSNNWFRLRSDLAKFVSENYYSPKWVSKLDSRKFINELEVLEHSIESYDECMAKALKCGIRSVNSELMLKLRQATSEAKGYKRASASEVKELYNELKKHVLNKRINEMHFKYRELAGRRYEKGKSAVIELKALINFIKLHNEDRENIVSILKNHNVQYVKDRIKIGDIKISQVTELAKRISSYLPTNIDFSSPTDVISYVIDAKAFSDKLNEIKQHMAKWLKNKARKVSIECFYELRDLENNHKAMINSLDHRKYSLLYGTMYRKDASDVNEISRRIDAYHNFISSFKSKEDANNVITKKSNYIKFSESLNALINANKNLDDVLQEYNKIFKEHIAKFLYDSFDDNKKRIVSLLSSYDELKDYVDVCAQLQVLYKYGLSKFAWSIYTGAVKDALFTFRSNYLNVLFKKLKEDNSFKYSEANDAISVICDLEKDLIRENLRYIQRRATRYAHKLAITSLAYFNRYLTPNAYDVVIMDDANMLDANDYEKVLSASQIILAGESSFRNAGQNSILLQFRSDDIVLLKHRYTLTPLPLLASLKELKGIIDYEVDAVEVSKDSPLKVILDIIKNDQSASINYYSEDLKDRRILIDQLFVNLEKQGLSQTDIIKLIKEQINICSIASGASIDADYNIINHDSCHLDSVSELCDNIVLAKKKFIICSKKNLEETRLFASDGCSFYLENSMLSKVAKSLKQKGFSIKGSLEGISLIAMKGKNVMHLYLLGDNDFDEVYDVIRNACVYENVENVKTYLLWAQEVVEDYDGLINKICARVK